MGDGDCDDDFDGLIDDDQAAHDEERAEDSQDEESHECDGSGALDARVQAATDAHKDAKAAHEEAKTNVLDKQKAKENANRDKTDAFNTKQATRGLPAQSSRVQDWKAACQRLKDADSDLKEAKRKAKEADEARSKAWRQLTEARAEVAAKTKQSHAKAAARFHSKRNHVIRAPRQASEGLKQWDGCPGVTHVRLSSARLPPLDGHEETAVNGEQVRFEPIPGGATVLVSGTGGMKTVRTLDFMRRETINWLRHIGKINAELPFVYVTARINLAHKLEADLKGRGINVHNYKNCPKGMSMEAWMKHPHVIISVEQVYKLQSWIHLYQNGSVVIDECVTAASSIVNGVTVHCPESTLDTLRELTDASSYLILMDADFDSDGKGRTLLKHIAPKKYVLFVQTIAPSLPTTVFYGYSGIKKDKLAFGSWLELSCRTSAEERRNGVSPDGNRTYIGHDWPSKAISASEQMRKWDVNAKCLHGGLGGKIRKDALNDLDAFVKDDDAFIPTSVAGIATDQNCKYRQGFIILESGDHAPGPRQAAQKIGRLNRDRSKPLDPFTSPNGKHYPGGAVFVLLPGKPPKLKESNFKPEDRAWHKFRSMLGDVNARRRCVVSTQIQTERRCELYDALYVQQGSGVTRLNQDAARSEGTDIATTVAELEAWNMVEDDDKQPNSFTIKFMEMMALPNRNFQLERMPSPGPREQEELERLRGEQRGSQSRWDLPEDEQVGEMKSVDKYFFIKERVEAEGDELLFWKDGYAMCVPGHARRESDNIDEALMEVWDTLYNYKIFPDADCGDDGDDEDDELKKGNCLSSKAFVELHRDRGKQAIYHRGIMRFLSVETIQFDEMRNLQNGYLSDPTVGYLRPAYKLPLLQELARVLRLSDVNDLLEPRKFSPSAYEWARAHNRLVEGGDAAEEECKSMARVARTIAIRLGCKGIRHGEKVKKPTSLLATVHAVLTQCCAMRPPKLKKNDARSAMGYWEVQEMAPGYAELGLYWHDGLQEKIPLREYAERDAKWRAHAKEVEEQRRSREARLVTDAMFDSFDCMDTENTAQDDSLSLQRVEPYDQNVLHVHYDATALNECLDAWRADESQRNAAAAALSGLSAERKATLGVDGDDSELVQLGAWLRALRRLETRHRIAITLRDTLPQAATDGPLKGALVAREEYEYKADGEGRRWAKGDGWLDVDGKLRSATSQGMPSDLRKKVLGWKFDDADGRKSDLTIYVILACKLRLPRSAVDVLIGEYLIILDRRVPDEVSDKWHSDVAAYHGVIAAIVKRWPNIFGNGGSYKTCLEKAGVPLDIPPDPRVKRMESALHKLRETIAKASREKPNALWNGSEQFWNRHDARLQREMPWLTPRERFNKVFSYLIGTAEDKILSIHMEAQRFVRREAIGSAKFDAMPVEQRDTGCLAFDGLNVERVCDPEVGNKAAEKALIRTGWHAQYWGIEYGIVTKPMFGEQHVSPDDFDTAKAARSALQEAVAAYPEVATAVANPSTYHSRSLPLVGGNASVIPVHNGFALLPIEVRGKKEMYGLFGGKAEPGETLADTAAREACEATGCTLSDASCAAIRSLDSTAFKECKKAAMYVAVVPIGSEDYNFRRTTPSDYDKTNANRPGSTTKHVGVEWIDISNLLNHGWRRKEMHYHDCLMVLTVRAALEEQCTTTNARLTGEKRPRDELPGNPNNAQPVAAVEAHHGERQSGELKTRSADDDPGDDLDDDSDDGSIERSSDGSDDGSGDDLEDDSDDGFIERSSDGSGDGSGDGSDDDSDDGLTERSSDGSGDGSGDDSGDDSSDDGSDDEAQVVKPRRIDHRRCIRDDE